MRTRGWANAVFALSLTAAILVMPASGGASLSSLGAAPAAAAPSPPGPLSSGSYSPAVRFTALEHPVRFWSRILSEAEPADSSHGHLQAPAATFNYSWFGEVTAVTRSENTNLSYAVEHQHDPSGYQFCSTPSICADLSVGVTPEGLLYLQWQQSGPSFGFLADFPTRTVELSAADADTSLKVYRETLVGPPAAVSGCEDYGKNNPDAYACLFLREVIPEGIGDYDDEATLRASLPGLVQPAANYNLVFGEEFNGTPPPANAAGCRDGLSTLDSDVWSYQDACDNVDSKGESCNNVVDGRLVMALAGTCHVAKVSTHGNLHVKYGYFEVKFTVNTYGWRSAYHNYNVILHARSEVLRGVLDRYGVEIEDWEDFLTNLDIEIDFVEFNVGDRYFVGHQYANAGFGVPVDDIPPTFVGKLYGLCGYRPDWSIVTNPSPDGRCGWDDTYTVTLGTEWTPGGYRTFVKVDEFGGDLKVVPEDKLLVWTKPIADGRPGDQQLLSGAARDPYLEYTDPDDPATLLEKVAVSHVPLPLNIGAWGHMNAERHPHILTRMKIDYIRMWQPDDHYSNMEPVYQ